MCVSFSKINHIINFYTLLNNNYNVKFLTFNYSQSRTKKNFFNNCNDHFNRNMETDVINKLTYCNSKISCVKKICFPHFFKYSLKVIYLKLNHYMLYRISILLVSTFKTQHFITPTLEFLPGSFII